MQADYGSCVYLHTTRTSVMSNYSLSDLTHCFRLGLPCLFSKLQLPILVTAPENWSLSPSAPSTRFLGRDQHLRMSRTLHRPAPDPLLHPTDGHYGQEGWYPRHDPTMRLAALDAERIPDRKRTSRCVMMTLHLGRDDRGKENAVSPP